MPRRPRPASREKPAKEGALADVASSSKSKLSLPKVTSKRSPQAAASEPESVEEYEDDNEGQSSDSEEEDEGGGSDDVSLGDPSQDGEESDIDVDAPRVAQWVDEEDLEQSEVHSGNASFKEAVDMGDIVGIFPVSPNL